MSDCNFKCLNLKNNECQYGGGECVEDDCPNWMDCSYCCKTEDCDE